MTEQITIKNKIAEIETVFSNVEIIAEKWNLPVKMVHSLNLVIEELVANTISYGFTDDLEHDINIFLELDEHQLTLSIHDDGAPFNPLEKSAPESLDKSVEDREIGGLGIFFVKNLMDSVTYDRVENKNIITLKKSRYF